jgi:SAM-dependent MidA family methyltransferase
MTPLHQLISRVLSQSGGWLSFDRFMALALYAPNLGYYSARTQPIGLMASSGSDFVTAPQMSPYFSRALARSVEEALVVSQNDEVWEFGAGTGEMAFEVLNALGEKVHRYVIVEVSSHLKDVQAQKLERFKGKVVWLEELPERFCGVVLGNEVLDAMPVKLIQRQSGVWHEVGVAIDQATLNKPKVDEATIFQLAWARRVTELRPPIEISGAHDYLTEIHPQAQAFIQTLAERLDKGVVFLIDYGFPEHEYYHEQRSGGTLMCHQGHLADSNPLLAVGQKDITAHVNFTGMALAAQEAGMDVLGYTTQAHFLINSGLLGMLETASPAERALALKLIAEHEMGELFKVLSLGVGLTKPKDLDDPDGLDPHVRVSTWEPMGFKQGDRTHTL